MPPHQDNIGYTRPLWLQWNWKPMRRGFLTNGNDRVVLISTCSGCFVTWKHPEKMEGKAEWNASSKYFFLSKQGIVRFWTEAQRAKECVIFQLKQKLLCLECPFTCTEDQFRCAEASYRMSRVWVKGSRELTRYKNKFCFACPLESYTIHVR